LKLQSDDGRTKPTQPLNFFDSSGPGPSVTVPGGGIPITGNIPGATYTGAVVTNNPQLIYYQVTIK